MADQSALLQRLVEHTLTANGLQETVRQARVGLLFSYAVRLLGSNLPSPVLEDEQSVIQALRLELEQRGSQHHAAKLLDSHARLAGMSGLSPRTRSALLSLMRKVSRDNHSQGPASSLLQASYATLTPLSEQAGLPALLPTSSQGGPDALGSTQQSLGASGAAYRVSFPPSLNSSFSGIQPQGNASSAVGLRTQPQGGAVAHQRSLRSLTDDAGTFTVKEPLLVRDVLFACQGIPGKYTLYSEDQGGAADLGGFSVVPEAQVPDVERTLVARLTELGWLFRRVQEHAGKQGSGGRGSGAVRQALCGALHAELSDFYRLMAVMEAHASQPIPVPGEAEPGAPYLTLRRMVVWLGEPLRRMRALALLADSTAHLSGGALAGAVHAHALHGDPFISRYMGKVLHVVCSPLLDMIKRWVFEGVLDDPHAEFFVRAANWVKESTAAARDIAGELRTLALTRSSRLDGAGGEGRDLWRQGYWLDESQLPPFISPQLAQKVLRAGKSINFLQDVCSDSHWVQEAASSASAAAAGQASGLGAVEVLERVVADASALVDKRLLEVLMERYGFAKHCEAIRRYLLLGQGDFVQALMDLVSKELDQEAGAVSEMGLAHALRQALAASCSRYEEEDVVERLRARKDRSATGGEQGWDVFTLTYDVRGPLAAIFTPQAMAQYLREFQLLWRLKRTEFSLAAVWSSLKCEVERTLARLAPESEGTRAAEEVVRRCLRLRADMSHFVTNLQYYLMFEVMEAAWQEFSRRATSAGDLDQLIAAHEDYLATLLRKSLLDEGSESLRVTLSELTSNMLGLHGLVRRLDEVVQAADRRLAAKRRRIQQRTAAGQWGTVAGDDSLPDGVPREDLEPISRRLDELARTHARALQAFTEKLPAQAHDEVRFLLYRLDFNEFNARMRRSAEDDE